MTDDTYQRLAAPFEVIQHDVRGGVEIDFITGEQCASRLNEVLGVGGWNFKILHQDIHQEADEAWVLGELDALIDGQRVIKQQFGSQKIKRSRSTGAPLDLGFDLKGAGTDCLKKCATMIGVGLFLYDKTAREAARRATQQQRSTQQERQAARVAPGKNNLEPTPMRPADKPTPPPLCEECEKPLQPVEDNNWTVWSLANEGQKRFKRTLCWEHFQQSVTKAAV